MGILTGLSEFLFGVDPIDNSRLESQTATLQQQAAQYQAREAQDYANQNRYGSSLWNTINGNNPSAAQRSLQGNLDQINRGANSMVSGASGNTGALARYGAILGQGDQAAMANQQAAILQAQEIAAAQQQVGGLYANQGARSAGLYGQNLNMGLNYDQLIAANQQANQKAQGAAMGALLGTAGTIGAAYMTGGAAPAIGAIAGQQAGQQMSANSQANGGGYNASMSAGGAGAPAYIMPDTAANYGQTLAAPDYPGAARGSGGGGRYYYSP
jgi:hypothetical protein